MQFRQFGSQPSFCDYSVGPPKAYKVLWADDETVPQAEQIQS